MKCCPKCQNVHSKSGKFCSRVCANSRGPRNQEFKDRVSVKLSGRTLSNQTIEKIKRTNYIRGNTKPNFPCVICKSPKPRKRKTCSDECRKELIRRQTIGKSNLNRPNSGYFDEIFFDSSWELAFYIWAKDNLPIIQRPDYYFTLGNIKYRPDFFDGEVYYEIKGRPYLNNLQDKINLMQQLGFKLQIISDDSIQTYIDYALQKYKKPLANLYVNPKISDKKCVVCCSSFSPKHVEQFLCSSQCSGKFRRQQNLKNNRCGWFPSEGSNLD